MNKKTEALMKTLTTELRLTENVAVIHSASEDTPRTVAFISMDKSLSVKEKLEKAFMLTNSIEDAWYTSDKVNYVGPEKSCRSTSVGDFVLIGKTKYECKSEIDYITELDGDAGWSEV